MKISNLDNFYEWTEGRIIDLLDTFSHGKFKFLDNIHRSSTGNIAQNLSGG